MKPTLILKARELAKHATKIADAIARGHEHGCCVVPRAVPNPTLVAHGLVKRSLYHVLTHMPPRRAVADLYAGSPKQAKEITRLLSIVLGGIKLDLLDNTATPRELKGHPIINPHSAKRRAAAAYHRQHSNRKTRRATARLLKARASMQGAKAGRVSPGQHFARAQHYTAARAARLKARGFHGAAPNPKRRNPERVTARIYHKKGVPGWAFEIKEDGITFGGGDRYTTTAAAMKGVKEAAAIRGHHKIDEVITDTRQANPSRTKSAQARRSLTRGTRMSRKIRRGRTSVQRAYLATERGRRQRERGFHGVKFKVGDAVRLPDGRRGTILKHIRKNWWLVQRPSLQLTAAGKTLPDETAQFHETRIQSIRTPNPKRRNARDPRTRGYRDVGTPAVGTITVRGTKYTVHAMRSKSSPWMLVGPRGAQFYLVRYINKPWLLVAKNANTGFAAGKLEGLTFTGETADQLTEFVEPKRNPKRRKSALSARRRPGTSTGRASGRAGSRRKRNPKGRNPREHIIVVRLGPKGHHEVVYRMTKRVGSGWNVVLEDPSLRGGAVKIGDRPTLNAAKALAREHAGRTRNPKGRTRKAARRRTTTRRPGARAARSVPRRQSNPGTAADLVRTFEDRGPLKLKTRKVKTPAPLKGEVAQIGEVVAVTYRSKKFDGKSRDYEHEFGSPRPLLVADPRTEDLNLVRGRSRYRLTSDGIIN